MHTNNMHMHTHYCRHIVFIKYNHLVVPPTIVRQPTQQVVDIHQNVTFHCEAEGFRVKYLWKKYEGDEHREISNSSNLIIPNVTPFNNGQYYCEAINNGGTTSSNIVSLEVKGNL